MDGTGSTSGTGELGAEYRLFMSILIGGVPDPSLLGRKNAGVDMRMLAGSANGGLSGLGDSVRRISCRDALGVGSRLSDHRLLTSCPLDPLFTGRAPPECFFF